MAVPTYLELSALTKTSNFVDRVTVAVTRYAQFILGENPATNDHQRRFNWARSAITSPSGTAGQILYAIALDAAIKNQDPLNFATTSDATVQTVVETAVNQYLLAY